MDLTFLELVNVGFCQRSQDLKEMTEVVVADVTSMEIMKSKEITIDCFSEDFKEVRLMRQRERLLVTMVRLLM